MSLSISINTNTFALMKDNFDAVLTKTITTMRSKDVEDADIALKLKVKLHKVEIPRIDQEPMIAYVPEFKHEVSSAMTLKDKISAEDVYNEFSVEWDEEAGEYVMNEIDSGQISFFSKKNDKDDKAVDKEEKTAEIEEKQPVNEEVEAFKFLKQFVGEKMFVTENEGHYAVRTGENKIILVSNADPSYRFYCSPEVLKKHVGHECICVSYADPDTGELYSISIECDDCSKTVFDMNNPEFKGLEEDEDAI